MAPLVTITARQDGAQQFKLKGKEAQPFVEFLLAGFKVYLIDFGGYERVQDLLTGVCTCLVAENTKAPFCAPLSFGSIYDNAFCSSKPYVMAQQSVLGTAQLYLWDPERLADVVKVLPQCPCCKGKASGDGWTKSVRKVFGYKGMVYLFSKRAKCRAKAHDKPYHFSLTDDAVLAALPEGVRHLLPMDLTPKGGMAWELQHYLVAAAPTGSSIASLCNVRNEVAVNAHVQEEVKYVDYLRAVAAKSTGQSLKAVPFPAFKDKMAGGENLTASYATNHLHSCTKELCEYALKHMRSLTFMVVKLDAEHKNSKKIRTVDGSRLTAATVTAMNEYGQIVGMWRGGGGIKELADMLCRLNARNVALGKEVRVVYMDNTHVTNKLLEEYFPGMPSDGGVKEDLFHVIERMRRCLVKNHSLKDAFMGDYSRAFRILNDEDVKRCEVLGVEVTKKTCRSHIPCPAILLARLEGVIHKYDRAVCANTGQELLNPGARKQLEIVKELIRVGRLSDPEDCEMHVNLEKDPSKPPEYRCFRGTSQLEGFHKHLQALLPGHNTSSELADLLTTLFVLRWNRKAAVKLGSEEYYGTMDYVLLEKVNRKYRELGMEEPYKSVAVRESGVEERFMSDWRELPTGS